MAKATWSGVIQFSMISIPIKMYTATESSKRLKFNQLNAATNNRIKQKRVDEETGEEVPYGDIVKGYELSKDTYVIVDPDELDELAPERSSTVEILGFIDQGEIDPIYYDRPYYVASQEGGEKPYMLFAEALQRSGRVAIGRFVSRTREYLCVLRPADGGLILSTMHWHDQVRDPSEFRPDTDKVELKDNEVEMAANLIEAMSDEVDITALHDTYRERVLELIQAKAEGKELVRSTEAPQPSEDLFAALEASLSEAKKQMDQKAQ